jgi:hypothetical protein
MIFVVETVPFVINWKRGCRISHEAFGTRDERTISPKMAKQ